MNIPLHCTMYMYMYGCEKKQFPQQITVFPSLKALLVDKFLNNHHSPFTNFNEMPQ